MTSYNVQHRDQVYQATETRGRVGTQEVKVHEAVAGKTYNGMVQKYVDGAFGCSKTYFARDDEDAIRQAFSDAGLVVMKIRKV